MPLILALTTHSIDETIFHVASALQVPVLILALVSLAAVIFELGGYCVEVYGRRGRRFDALLQGAGAGRAALEAGDVDAALRAVAPIARSSQMAAALRFMVTHASAPGADNQLNKALADFDLDSQRRLGRTRVLVRLGPALGLMGTLIPLSPALTGLANGNTAELSRDLRVAFSVTVVGLLIGAVAFAISLSRDRLYSQDLSDLPYVAAVLTTPSSGGVIDPRGHTFVTPPPASAQTPTPPNAPPEAA